jgi:hypothetical protein
VGWRLQQAAKGQKEIRVRRESAQQSAPAVVDANFRTVAPVVGVILSFSLRVKPAEKFHDIETGFILGANVYYFGRVRSRHD